MLCAGSGTPQAGGGGPQVDEHVVGVDRPVIAVQVIGIQPHQGRARRDLAAPAALGVRPVRVVPRDHAHQAAADVDVLVPHAQGLADPDPVSSSIPSSSRSRRRPQASRTAWASAAVSTRGSGRAAVTFTASLGCGLFPVT